MTIKPIRNATDLHTAKTRLGKLLSKSNTAEHDDEIEVLTALIERFEETYAPVDAPNPIAAIKFRMQEKGLSPRRLEPYIGSRARVSEVLSGKRQLSIEMIRALHEGLGIPYESLISANPKSTTIDALSSPTIERLNELGFSVRRQEIPTFISASMHKSVPVALLRKTRTQRATSKTDQAALLLWQAAVLRRHEGSKPLEKFDQAKFTANELRQIGRMSSKLDGPRRAITELRNDGISVVLMPPLPKTFLDGAALVSQAGTPVVGLTLRNDRLDNFWFTLLHELAHISLHYNILVETHAAFVDDLELRSEDECERQADALARDSLIPQEILKQVEWSEVSNYDDLITVSTRARVHIAVVAGRWQRDHQNYKKFARLIDRTSVKAAIIENPNS